MAVINVQTLDCYKKCRFTNCWGPEPEFIGTEQLVGVLNSAADPTDEVRQYVVLPPKEKQMEPCE